MSDQVEAAPHGDNGALPSAHRTFGSWFGSLWQLLSERRAGTAMENDRWAAVAFIAIAVPLGLMFVFLIPPSQVIDEESHFMRVWQLSELNLRTETRFDPVTGMDRNGSLYDVCVVEYLAETVRVAQSESAFSFRDTWLETPDCSQQRRSFEFFDTAVGYGPWSYPGQTAALSAARAIGLPVPLAFHLGRLGGLLVFVVAVTAALRIAPRGRLAILAVGLLPMSLMTASAYNADGIMIGGSLLAVACVLRLALDDQLGHRHRWLVVVLSVSLAAVVLTKPNYVVMLGLLVLVPLNGFRSPAFGRWTLVGIAAGIAGAAALSYSMLGGASNLLIYHPDADPSAQVRALVSDPFGFLRVVWNTLFSYTYEVFFLRGWVGVFGMLRTGRPDVAPLLAVPFVILAFIAVATALAVEAGPKRDIGSRDSWMRLAVVGSIGVAGVMSVFAVAFVSWTTPRSDIIDGVQGRYLLPFVPLVAAGLALRRHRSNMSLGVRGVVLVAVVLGVASIDKFVALFY